MKDLFGYLVLISIPVIAMYLVYRKKANLKIGSFIAATGLAMGICIISADKIEELSLFNHLFVKAKRAIADAEAVEKLLKKAEAHSDSIAMIVRDANEARDKIKSTESLADTALKKADDVTQLTADLKTKYDQADEKLVAIDQSLQNANQAVEDLNAATRLTTLIMSAQNDSRAAYDELKLLAKENPLAETTSLAEQAVQAILDKYEAMQMIVPVDVPWNDHIKPDEMTLKQFLVQFPKESPDVRRSLVRYIWNRKDFPKYDRMQFLIDTLKNDPSLKVVDYAGRKFQEESKDRLKSVFIEGHVDWWEKYKDTIKADEDKQNGKSDSGKADVAADPITSPAEVSNQ